MASDEIDSKEQLYGSTRIGGSSAIEKDMVISKEFDLDKDYYIISELIPQQIRFVRDNESSSRSSKAEIIRQPITRQIQFRLAVYNSAGNFVLDKIYTISSSGAVTPNDGQALTIDRGQYSFVAYSYNTNTAPTESLAGTTINYAIPVNSANYPQFMMLNSGLITISPDQTNNLNIIFRYKFSPMTVEVDASATNGYLISSIGATSLNSTRSSATVSFASGDVAFGTSSASAANIVFPSTANAAVRTSNVTWVANSTTTGALTINSLEIGPLSRATPLTLNNVNIAPGVGYILRVRIVLTDRFETINSQEAALIAGRYWMRRNVGATGADPDNPTGGNFQSLFGNYYQWGRIEVRATPTTGATAPASALWTTSAPNGAWYNASSTATGGKVTANDPCPAGWRVPTAGEFQSLIDATTQLASDNRGTDWTASNTQYSNAKVFRSRRDRNVILTFPSAGYYEPTARALTNRGSSGAYWLSSEGAGSTTNSRRVITLQPDGSATIGTGTSNRAFAISVRCTRAVL